MTAPTSRPALPPGARLVLATHNPGKLAELRDILRADPRLADLPAEAVISAADLGVAAPVEDGATFEENSLIKARALAKATGLPAVADDSGLAVDVLGGAPGIFSALWSGRHGADRENLELLLAQLVDIRRPAQRKAGFVCAAALVTPAVGATAGSEVVCRGEMRGTLRLTPAGDGGFGYDPILVPDEQAANADGSPGTRTAAELTPQEKNAISHRGKAFRQLAGFIAEALDA
ncbi:MAG: RdgB/HAM1 family non-canonical purine NTP pyrophosphatase [Promicromonosporaceae bacterium]|nr:RdgB/HAM1 family non-canonical purine NTP pyrophosphatase [Promicromonosporaceae bacterium]